MPFYRGMRLARPAPGTGGGLSPDARAAFAREAWIKLNAGNPRPIRAWAVTNSDHVTSRNIARQRLHAPKPVTTTATVPNKRVGKKSPPKRKDPVVKHGKEDHMTNALVAKQRKVSGRKTVAAGNAVRKEAVVEKTTEDEPKAPARKRAKLAAATTHKNLPTTPGLTSGQRGDTTNDVAAATPAAFCWDEEHNAHLLEIVKDVKPAIGKDWDRVAQAFNDKFSATR